MKKVLFGAALAATMILANACTKPEIAIVLEDYCDFKVDECDMQSPGTSHYSSKKECDRYHKDMLNSVSDGNGGCSDIVEDFFIQVMNSQMAGGCNYSFTSTLFEEETSQILTDMITCLQDSGSNLGEMVPDIVRQIYDEGPEVDNILNLLMEKFGPNS